MWQLNDIYWYCDDTYGWWYDDTKVQGALNYYQLDLKSIIVTLDAENYDTESHVKKIAHLIIAQDF